MKVQIETIKDLIKQGMLKDALDMLVVDTNDTKFEIDSILMIARYNKLMSDKSRNLIDGDDEQREYNRIIVSTLEMLDNIYFEFFHNVVEFYQIKFYETPFETRLVYEERTYATQFENAKTRAVGWEIWMRYPKLMTTVDIALDWEIIYPDGTKKPKYTASTQLSSNWSNSWITNSYGRKDVNGMPLGTYKINFYIGDKCVASGSYLIQ
jgi:Effector-associated domain 11